MDNKVRVTSSTLKSEIGAMHRPSVVFDSSKKIFHLYFDQSGILTGAINPESEQRWIGDFIGQEKAVAEYELNLRKRKEKDCNNGVNNCETRGGPPIRHAVGSDGKNFILEEPKNRNSVARGVSPDVQKFNKGWILFSDLWKNQSSLETVKNAADIKSIFGTYTSTDGVNFSEVKPIYSFDDYVLPNNVSIISDGDSLRGVLYGSFRAKDPAFECPSPYFWPSWGNVCIVHGEINALFLQKKIVFRSEGCELSKAVALDEDRIQLRANPSSCPKGIPENGLTGLLEIFDTDGTTLLYKESKFTLKKGRLYQLTGEPSKPSEN